MPFTDAALSEQVKKLEDRAFSTYQARLKAHERLHRRNNAWNASLVALATSTTIASVGVLVERNMYGSRGDSLLVSLAILSLVASLVVSSVNYGSRARAMEASYKRIQQISVAAESFFVGSSPPTRQRLLELQREYGIAVESSENHSEADYLRSCGQPGRRVWRDTFVTAAPYVTLVVPLALLVSFAKWYFAGI